MNTLQLNKGNTVLNSYLKNKEKVIYIAKYGIKINTCGIYKITNILTNDFYIGASKDIARRLSTHFNRDSKRYKNHKFYEDIRKYGVENFKYEVIEECSESKLLTKEQYYYDILNPTYNIVRPTECHFDNPISRMKATLNANTPEKVNERKSKYNSEEYKLKFKKTQSHRMRPVILIDSNGNKIIFESLSECQRWLNENTTYKSKNKISKIKEVCEGKRKSAFGYKFKYEEV